MLFAFVVVGTHFVPQMLAAKFPSLFSAVVL